MGNPAVGVYTSRRFAHNSQITIQFNYTAHFAMAQQETNITITTTNRGNPAILSRGSLYVKDRETKKSKTWRCSIRGRPARLKTSLDFKDPIYSNEHNHELKTFPSPNRKLKCFNLFQGELRLIPSSSVTSNSISCTHTPTHTIHTPQRIHYMRDFQKLTCVTFKSSHAWNLNHQMRENQMREDGKKLQMREIQMHPATQLWCQHTVSGWDASFLCNLWFSWCGRTHSVWADPSLVHSGPLLGCSTPDTRYVYAVCMAIGHSSLSQHATNYRSWWCLDDGVDDNDDEDDSINIVMTRMMMMISRMVMMMMMMMVNNNSNLNYHRRRQNHHRRRHHYHHQTKLQILKLFRTNCVFYL